MLEPAEYPHAEPATAGVSSANPAAEIDLDQVLFAAKIDQVRFASPGHCRALNDALGCRLKWQSGEHYKSFAVHDPSPNDLIVVRSILGAAPVLYLEVAVDLRPRPAVPRRDRPAFLEVLMVDLISRQLCPSGVVKGVRVYYDPIKKKTQPFNKRLPPAQYQQLHGWKGQPCQVTAYLKRLDQGAALSPADFVARLEVRLLGSGLSSRGIHTVDDLFGFKFRKQLQPFFTHMKGVQQRRRRGQLPPAEQDVTNRFLSHQDQRTWDRVGIGGFTAGGSASKPVRLLRNVKVNDRIGQALGRLEDQYRAKTFVCFADAANDAKPYLARLHGTSK
jgi:hypothetical protein